jgi:hypothetical protein
MMSQKTLLRARHALWFAFLLPLILLLAACTGKSTPASKPTQPPVAPQATAAPASSATKSTSNRAPVPPACALLTAADVEKITGYGNGTADSQQLGSAGIVEDANSCTIVAGQGKFKVEVLAGRAVPLLPNRTTVDLEGGAKGVVKDAGIGQKWMDEVEFPDYSVSLLVSGTAAKMDPDQKIATVTKADGSVLTYEQVYEALARAVAHNAATGAQLPGGVSDVSAKGDPCALLTLDEVKQVMSEFTMTGPESSPSAYGGNTCRFRGHSDSLQATAIIGVVYLTQAQFEPLLPSSGTKKIDLGISGATAYQYTAGVILLNKGNRYVRISIDTLPEGADKLDQIDAGLQKWLPQLAQRIAARLGQ